MKPTLAIGVLLGCLIGSLITVSSESPSLERPVAGASDNLLVDPSFERPAIPDWTTFNNAEWVPGRSRTGSNCGLILGPFYDLPNHSGLLQDVPASEGDVFEASIWCLNDANVFNKAGKPDVIAGTGNAVALAVEWLVAGEPVKAARTPVFRGDDPDLPIGDYVQAKLTTPPAPAGTTAARWVLFFEQPATADPGLVYFDDAAIRRLR